MLFLGNPEYGCELEPVNFSVVAHGFGVRAFRVEDPQDCRRALNDALAHDGPALVDAVVDTNEPMLPPKRRETYVKNLEAALSKGTPRRGDIQRALGEAVGHLPSRINCARLVSVESQVLRPLRRAALIRSTRSTRACSSAGPRYSRPRKSPV